MTQRDLAAALDRPPSYIGKIEAGERNVSVLELIAWAEALGAEPTTLFERIVVAVDRRDNKSRS